MGFKTCSNCFAVLSEVIRWCLGLLIGLCAECSVAEDQISFGSLSFTYDSESRLSEVYSNGMRIVVNKYDYMGRRVKKITMDAERTFIYDDWRPMIERIVWADGREDRMEYFWGKDVSGVLDGASGAGYWRDSKRATTRGKLQDLPNLIHLGAILKPYNFVR